MPHPTDRRSIVANLVWGILTICLVGLPSATSGQAGQPVSEQAGQAEEVPAWEVEGFHWEGDTLVIDGHAFEGVWTGPVPAQDVEDLDVWTRLTWTLRMVVAPGTLAHVSPLYAYGIDDIRGRTVHPDRIRPVATVKPCSNKEFLLLEWTPASPDEPNDVSWCAYYTSETIGAFHLTDRLTSSRPDGNGLSDAYFATTYPLRGVAPKKRFVVEQPE